jgi:hypothetical protein
MYSSFVLFACERRTSDGGCIYVGYEILGEVASIYEMDLSTQCTHPLEQAHRIHVFNPTDPDQL